MSDENVCACVWHIMSSYCMLRHQVELTAVQETGVMWNMNMRSGGEWVCVCVCVGGTNCLTILSTAYSGKYLEANICAFMFYNTADVGRTAHSYKIVSV